MLAELRQKSQVTIPEYIIECLGLNEGDKFEIYEKEGTIYMTPVAVYPEEYLERLRVEIDEVKAAISSGEQPLFSGANELFAELEID